MRAKKRKNSIGDNQKYGTFLLVEENYILQLQHTTGSSNASHRLYITLIKDAQGNVIGSNIGVLKTDNQGSGIYNFDYSNLKVDSDRIACTIAASAMRTSDGSL